MHVFLPVLQPVYGDNVNVGKFQVSPRSPAQQLADRLTELQMCAAELKAEKDAAPTAFMKYAVAKKQEGEVAHTHTHTHSLGCVPSPRSRILSPLRPLHVVHAITRTFHKDDSLGEGAPSAVRTHTHSACRRTHCVTRRARCEVVACTPQCISSCPP
jgi:hypothetical protein